MDSSTKKNIQIVMDALTATLETNGYYHVQTELLYKLSCGIIQKFNGNIEASIAECELFVKRNKKLLDAQNEKISRVWQD